LLIACSIVASPTSSPACCPAWRPGQPVRIADQQILVIWDPDTRTEHFIREAKFSARAEGVEGRPEGFGFLVPSPTLPEIAAADGSVFGHLNDRIKPRIEEVTRWRTHYSLLWRLFAPTSLVPTSRAMTDTAPPPMASVEVMRTARVGGYDVAVLKASDPLALTEWLATNGFDSRPELTEWSRPYVDKGWMITAFKYAADAATIDVSAVRMSFETDTPIFPYRVPTDQIDEEARRRNTLRAFVIGPGRAAGTLGEGRDARPWAQGKIAYSHPLEVNASFLGSVLPDGTRGFHLAFRHRRPHLRVRSGRRPVPARAETLHRPRLAASPRRHRTDGAGTVLRHAPPRVVLIENEPTFPPSPTRRSNRPAGVTRSGSGSVPHRASPPCQRG
jgi:hypothetical protein